MKNKKYHAVGTIPNSDIKIVERGKIDTPNTQMSKNRLLLTNKCRKIDTPNTQMSINQYS